MIAAAPLFLKSNSFGEYVFDWGWAEAYEQAGGSYYPKLQVAVPFTPVPGPRLLGARNLLTAFLRDELLRRGLSSLHVTFCDEADRAALLEAGYLLRLGCQYHWHNRSYENFEDFLAGLSSRKRKMIRKERATLRQAGIETVALSGPELSEQDWDFFFRCYRSTAKTKWGRPYLTRRFFSLLGEYLGEAVVLIIARHQGEPVAAALNLRGQDALYGRNWGSLVDMPFLHFETCYYAAIDYALAHKLSRVEAGAQGEHKLQRGYEPVPIYSAHLIAHPAFAAAVADFLARERPAVEEQLQALREYLPYARS